MKSQAEISIRTAVIEDVPAILTLVRSLAEYENLLHAVSATEELLAKYGFGENAFYHTIIAENSDKHAVGFALYFYKFSTFLGKPSLYLEDLFVLPEFRGTGIGKLLLRELASIALNNDCARMEWVVLDWNKPAIQFYESIHAEPLSDWITFRLDKPHVEKLINT